MKQVVVFIFILLSIPMRGGLLAQDTSAVVTRAVIMNGDTVPMVLVSEVAIYGTIEVESKMEALAFTRMVVNVKKAYPYAKIVAAKSLHYNILISTATSKKEKRKMMKMAEKDLTAEFEDDVRNMSEAQGEILIKLVHRETGSTAFELIKYYRGGVEAFVYNTLSRLYSLNLKAKYEADGVDKDIEEVVSLIESGQL